MTYQGPTTGERNTLLTLQHRSTVKDSCGQDVVQWFDVAGAWAKLDGGAGREVDRARRLYADATSVVIIPYMRNVLTTARFRYGRRYLEIVDVGDPDNTRRFLVCICKEVAS